jgi:dTDP-glucose 4,6-dehydratase
LTKQKIPLYGDGKNKREWIYVKDHFKALRAIVEDGEPGQIYNVSSGHERENIEVLNAIFEIMGEGKDLLEYVDDRLGHDRRYSVDCNKLKALGWEPSYSFESALVHTVGWYKANNWAWRKK